jgi:fimbrial chaperone protein
MSNLKPSWMCIVVALTAAMPIVVPNAEASSFSVNPVQIYLSPKTPSALLTLRNDSDQPLRFQLSARSWEQSPDDEMELGPTRDVIFYPPLVTLAPKEERKIRVAVATPFGPTEKAYRLVVEELPQLDKPGGQPSGVAVLTRMSIPVFLQATKAIAQAELTALSIENGRLSFSVRNNGNTHFVAEKMTVRALDSAGAVLFDRPMNGWYVLAGRTRLYHVEISAGDCARTAAATVEVQIGSSVLKERLTAQPAACKP